MSETKRGPFTCERAELAGTDDFALYRVLDGDREVVARCVGRLNAEQVADALNRAEAADGLLAAAKLGLARIESDIEGGSRETGEGMALRTAIANYEGTP